MTKREILLKGYVADFSTYIQNNILPSVQSDEILFITTEETGEEFLLREGVMKKLNDVDLSLYAKQSSLSDVVRDSDITDVVRDSDITDVVRDSDISDFITMEDFGEPISISDMLSQEIDTKIATATADFITSDEIPAPLSQAQIDDVKNTVINQIINDGNGNITVNFQLPTPEAKIITPLNDTILQDDFTDLGDGTYRYTFDPATYGDGTYTIEICMA